MCKIQRTRKKVKMEKSKIRECRQKGKRRYNLLKENSIRVANGLENKNDDLDGNM